MADAGVFGKAFSPASEAGIDAVVGLDFGTAATACAVSICSAGAPASETYLVPLDNVSTHTKALTAVAIDRDRKEVVQFGSDCLDMDHSSPSVFIFYRFKMQLYKTLKHVRSMPNARGETMEMAIVDLLASVLRFIKAKLLHWAELTQGTALNPARIRWVLTVPAIWTDGAKSVMVESAIAAGLIDASSSWRLLLALEPECAAIEAHNSSALALAVGTHFAVLDCGGGTIDTTSFLVKSTVPSLELEQRTAPGGGDWGSTVIDDDVVALVTKLVSLGGWPEGRKFEGAMEMMLRERWSRIKRIYRAGDTTLGATAVHNLSLLDELDELDGPSLKELVDSYNASKPATQPPLSARRSNLVLSEESMQALYARCMGMIENHVQFLLERTDVKTASVFVMAGGFSACSLLKEKVSQKLTATLGAGRAKVLVPSDVELLVVRGAVRFGLRPMVVRRRVLPVTYAVAAAVTYDPALHGDRPKVWDPVRKEFRVRQALRALVAKNESVEIGRAITKTYLPTREDQQEVRVTIYATNDERALFVDHPSVVMVADVRMRIRPSTVPLGDRDVRLTLTFGATQLYLECQSFQHEYKQCECSYVAVDETPRPGK